MSVSPDLLLPTFYSGKKVLVTGGASFIGSHLTELLVKLGALVTVADDLSSGKLEHLDAVVGKFEMLRCDLRDVENALAACDGQQILFHLAAAHGGRGYIDTHPVDCTNNMLLDHTVFAAAAKMHVEKIVYAGSAASYPVNLQMKESERVLLRESDANFDEAGKAHADGEYGWAALMGEFQLRAFIKQHAIPAGVVCRIFNAYGERENESHAVIALIAKAVAKLDPYPIWGNGLQTRGFTHVEDIVTGMATAGAKFRGFETINIGTDQHHTILELAEEIFGALRWRPKTIEKQLDKPIGVKSRAAELGKCREKLGWAPRISLKEGVQRTVEHYAKKAGALKAGELEQKLLERA